MMHLELAKESTLGHRIYKEIWLALHYFMGNYFRNEDAE